MNTSIQNNIDQAIELDRQDELREYRSRFHIPKDRDGKDKVYLCGNSLGLQPKNARAFVEREMKDWENLGVDGHTHAQKPWMPYHEFLANHLAQVVGARSEEVVVMNSLTVNLHLMMVSFYRPTGTRFKIMIEKGAFPSDRYAVCSQILFHGLRVEDALIELTPRAEETCLREEDILQEIKNQGDHLALVLIGNVNYYTGQAFPMKSITEAGHAVGAIVAFDLAHGAGNIICDLHDSGADFAAWCSYKYLNSGPGALSGCFVHDRHRYDLDLPRFSGWWGHNKKTRFKMGPEFSLLPGAEGWQLSNPPILPMACMMASLEIFAEAGMNRLRNKSVQMTSFFLGLLEELDTDQLSVITPAETESRGSQLSIRMHTADRSLFEKLTETGVVADWREPDVIRVACAPLYNSFRDVVDFVHILRHHM